jgi:hypothetical protein
MGYNDSGLLPRLCVGIHFVSSPKPDSGYHMMRITEIPAGISWTGINGCGVFSTYRVGRPIDG